MVELRKSRRLCCTLGWVIISANVWIEESNLIANRKKIDFRRFSKTEALPLSIKLNKIFRNICFIIDKNLHQNLSCYKRNLDFFYQYIFPLRCQKKFYIKFNLFCIKTCSISFAHAVLIWTIFIVHFTIS